MEGSTYSFGRHDAVSVLKGRGQRGNETGTRYLKGKSRYARLGFGSGEPEVYLTSAQVRRCSVLGNQGVNMYFVK